MKEIQVNSGFGKFPVKDAIKENEKVKSEEEKEEEIKSFPWPFGRFSAGFVAGALAIGSFAAYWQHVNYGEIVDAFESIKSDTAQAHDNTEKIKGLVSKNEELANRIDANISVLSGKIESMKPKRETVSKR